MADIMLSAVYQTCSNCRKSNGALVIPSKQVINQEELIQFLNTNDVISLCDECTKAHFGKDRTMKYDTK